jgi:WD40 repeat protein
MRRELLIALAVSVASPVVRADDHYDMVPQLGHQVSAVAFSADGKLLVSGGLDNTTKVWDAETGILLRTLSGHVAPVATVAVSRDRVLAGSADGTARMWDTATGDLLGIYDHGSPVAAVGLGERDRIVVLGGGGTASIWEASTLAAQPGRSGEARAERERTARGHATRVASSTQAFTTMGSVMPGAHNKFYATTVASLSPSRTLALFGNQSGEVVLVVPRSGAKVAELSKVTVQSTGGTLTLQHEAFVTAVGWSADASRVAAGRENGAITIWDTRTGSEVRRLGASHPVTGLAFSPDARQLVTNGGELFDIATARIERRFAIVDATVVAFTSDAARIAFGGNRLEIRDARSGELVRTFAAPHGPVLRIGASRDSRRVITTTYGASGARTNVWDLETGAVRRILEATKEGVAALAPAGDRIASFTGTAIELRRVDSGALEATIQATGVSSLAFSPDGIRLAAGVSSPQGSASVAIWDRRSGRRVHEIPVDDATTSPISLAFSPDGKLLASEAGHVWDADTGRRVDSHDDVSGFSVAFSPDGQRLVVSGIGRCAILDRTANTSADCGASALVPTAAAFSRDGSAILIGDISGDLLIERVGGGIERRLRGRHDALVFAIEPLADGRHVLTGSLDGTARLWDLTDDNATITLVAEAGEWLAYTDSGYFDGSRSADKLLAAVTGLNGYGVRNLAIRSNRPDLILEKAGLGSPELVGHYRARHARRLDRLGVTEGQLASRFDLSPRIEGLTVTNDERSATIQFDVVGVGADLRRYDIYVNGTPTAPDGKPIAGRRQHVSAQIELSSGRNRIEVGAMDTSGAESERPWRVVTSSRSTRGDLYYIGFGVSRYRDHSLDLGYASRDALDLAYYASSVAASFNHVHVRTFTDEQVTVAAIRQAQQLVAKAGVDDTVVVFVAGHGVHTPDAAADYVFVTHDTDTHRLRETAASFDEIERLMASARSRRKLLLLDTCESGELLPDASVAPPGAQQRGLTSRRPRGLIRVPTSEGKPRPFLLERDRFIYNDLFRRTGTVVISSSQGNESSFESAALGNGAFTWALKAALSGAADQDHDGSLTIEELRRSLSHAVPAATNEQQHPTIDFDNPAAGVMLPVAVGIHFPPPIAPRGARGCGCRILDGSCGGWLALAIAAMLRPTRRLRLTASPRT